MAVLRADKLRALVGIPGHRLLALLLGLALTLLLRPSDAFAAEPPTAVECAQVDDVTLHTPRRSATTLDNDLRGFVTAFVGVALETWCGSASSSDRELSPCATSSLRPRCRAPCRADPRGPPHA
jgi:hypothetical protein